MWTWCQNQQKRMLHSQRLYEVVLLWIANMLSAIHEHQSPTTTSPSIMFPTPWPSSALDTDHEPFNVMFSNEGIVNKHANPCELLSIVLVPPLMASIPVSSSPHWLLIYLLFAPTDKLIIVYTLFLFDHQGFDRYYQLEANTQSNEDILRNNHHHRILDITRIETQKPWRTWLLATGMV